jgi:hypothetical protein
MTKTVTRTTEVPRTKRTVAPAAQEPQTNDSSAPIWKTQHNRVQGAMWEHPQEDGTTRFTVSISRSYKDKETDKWQSVHFFDPKDFKDIHLVCDEADLEILRLQGMTQEVGED